MLKYKVDTVNYVFDNMDAMAYFGSHPESKSYTTPDGDVISNKDFQQKVFIAYKALEPYMNALNELVQFTKIDTRKQGNTFIAMHNYLSKYEKLVNPRGEELRSNKFNLNVLQHMVKHSWIDFKTHSAILDAFEILGKQTFTGNVNFLSEVRRFCKDVCGQSNPSDRLLQTVARHYITAIKGRYISEYAKQRGVNIKNLLVGDFNMNSRLNMLKSAIADNPEKYGRLANNALLNQISSGDNAEDILYSGVLYKRPEFIQVNQNVDGSRIAADMLIDGWNDLLNDEDVNVRNFAKDLIVYAFVTSGESKGWGTLFKFVPQEWVQGMYDQGTQSFSDYIYDQLNRQNYEDLSYEVAQNNYMDTSIIKRVPLRDKDGNSNFIFTGKYSANGSPTVMVGTTYIEHSVFQRSTPSFITVKRSGKFSENAMGYDLYIHVSDMFKSVPGKKNPVALPVYALVQKKGYDTGFGKKVYQYGFEDNLGVSNLDSIDQEYLDKAYSRLSDIIDTHSKILDDGRYTELQIAEALSRVYVTEESNSNEDTTESTNSTEKQSDNSVTQSAADSIYNTIVENKPNIKVEPWNKLKDADAPYVTDSEGNITEVISTRIKGDPVESFGNTYSANRNVQSGGTYRKDKVDSIKSATIAYVNAILSPEKSNFPAHYEWIRSQIISGNLKGKPIVYYRQIQEPSHADALAFLIDHPELLETSNLVAQSNDIQSEQSLFSEQELEQMRKEGEQVKKHCKGE